MRRLGGESGGGLPVRQVDTPVSFLGDLPSDVGEPPFVVYDTEKYIGGLPNGDAVSLVSGEELPTAEAFFGFQGNGPGMVEYQVPESNPPARIEVEIIGGNGGDGDRVFDENVGGGGGGGGGASRLEIDGNLVAEAGGGGGGGGETTGSFDGPGRGGEAGQFFGELTTDTATTITAYLGTDGSDGNGENAGSAGQHFGTGAAPTGGEPGGSSAGSGGNGGEPGGGFGSSPGTDAGDGSAVVQDPSAFETTQSSTSTASRVFRVSFVELV